MFYTNENTKKIIRHFVALFSFLCVVFCSAYASSGYIVSLREIPIMLMSGKHNAEYIDDTLYKVNTVSEAYAIFGAENIEACFPDCEMELFDYPQTPSDEYFNFQWCHNSIKAEKAREKGLTGRGVKIAVIDSGVDVNHPDFDGVNFEQGYNCAENATDENDLSDIVGHGTTVTGVIAACTDNDMGIAGVASGVTVIPIKITETKKFSLSMLLKGLKKALETDCDIINMSLGGPITDSQTLAAFKTYTDEAEKRGITVVAAAGNSGNTNNDVNYPAAFDTVIGVGAVDKYLNVAVFSQRNEGVFITAPGVDIYSLISGGKAGFTGGTSFSSPMVAASLALVKQACPEYKGEDMRKLLMDTAVDLGAEGYDVSYGYGMLNLENMINRIQNRLPNIVVTEGRKNSVSRIHIHNNASVAFDAQLILSGNTLDIKDMKFESGVTNVGNMDGVETVMLWDNRLRPLVRKYFMK